MRECHILKWIITYFYIRHDTAHVALAVIGSFHFIPFRVSVNDVLFQCYLFVVNFSSLHVRCIAYPINTVRWLGWNYTHSGYFLIMFYSCVHTCTVWRLLQLVLWFVIWGSVIEYTCQKIAISFLSDVHFPASFRIQTFPRELHPP